MGQYLRLFGKATEVDPAKLDKQFLRLLIPGEAVRKVFVIILNYWVFTTKRLVIVEKKLLSPKVTYKSIPYKNIFRFLIETAGHTELESELTIWPVGMKPVKQVFGRNVDMSEIHRLLAGTLIKK